MRRRATDSLAPFHSVNPVALPVNTLDRSSVLVGFAPLPWAAEIAGKQVMKPLYSSIDLVELASYKSRLFKAGIKCEIVNEAVTPQMLELARFPELCVQNDADFMAASLLLAAWQRERPKSSRSRPVSASALDIMAA